MNKVKIQDKYIFLRLPRFRIELYINLLNKSMDLGLKDLLKLEYQPFLELLREHKIELYESVCKGDVSRKKYISILNYLMRSCSRSSVYKNFSGLAKLKSSQQTNFFRSTYLTVNENEPEIKTTINTKTLIKNPVSKAVGESYIYCHKETVKKIKSKKLNKLLINKKDNFFKMDFENIKLMKLGVLNEIPSARILCDDDNFPKRTSLSIELGSNEVSSESLKNIAYKLLDLSFLNGNDINKSILWIEKIRSHLFRIYSTNALPFLDIFLGENIFRESMEQLFQEAQYQITPMRFALSNLIADAISAGQEEVELKIKDVEILKESSLGVKTNISKNFGAIVKILNDSEYDAQIFYARSSFNGLRVISDIANDDKVENEVSSNTIYCDFVYSIENSKLPLIFRKAITSHAISLDGTPVGESQQEILLEDLWLYCGRNELVLFSKKMNKRIIPVTMTSYLSENSNDPIVRFFSALAKYHCNDGVHLDLFWMKRDFYPRITYKNLILFPKTWIISKKNCDDNFIKKLPKYIRVVNSDKDAFFDTQSEFFREQVIKVDGDLLHIQEDFSFESCVETADGKYFNELFFSFSDMTKDSLPEVDFRPYETSFSPVGNHIHEIRVCAPSNLVEDLMEHISKQLLGNLEYFFIFYQIPSSHIRLRLFCNLNRSVEVLNQIRDIKEYLISDVSLVPYEYELSTYTSMEGIELYWQYSKISTSFYVEQLQSINLNKLGVDHLIGPNSSVIVLAFYSYFLLSNELEEFPNVKFSDDYAFYSVKKIFEFIKKDIDVESSTVYSLKSLAFDMYKKTKPIFEEWANLFFKKLVYKDCYFFKLRMIHMEIFRLTNGSFPMSNDAVLKIAKEIYKYEKYSKR